jgi:SAM-dependent methyltransferase
MTSRDHYESFYAGRAADYERLIRCEDAGRQLLPAIEALITNAELDLASARVVEFGAGTGRLTRMVAPKVAHVAAFDASPAMIDVARAALRPLENVSLGVAEHAALPARTGEADVALEGWAFAHAVSWHPTQWQAVVSTYLDEVSRVLRPGGVAILIETLGTGSFEAAPPSAGLAALYAWWESLGFSQIRIRTDYHFESIEEARALTQAFFRKDFDFEVASAGVTLREHTGLWWRRAS